MTDDEYDLIHSPLGEKISQDGKTVQVEIYRGSNSDWILEVVDEYGNSTVWDDPFATDAAALDEVQRTIKEEGIDSLIGSPSPIRDGTTPPGAGLSIDEQEELEDFLLSDATSDETMLLDTLDGFLTALVSSPVPLMPSQWLPKVWGESSEDEPVFDSIEQAMRITELIMRHMNGIGTELQRDAEGFQPLFDMASYPDDPHEYVDGEMWAHGYITGINLCRSYWTEFFRTPESAEIYRPIRLLGDDDLPEEEWHWTENPQQREALTEKIPASVAWIYRFWQPYRQAMAERIAASTYQREHPKIGRNDPCPCGSGKKFKKCCGSAQLLH